MFIYIKYKNMIEGINWNTLGTGLSDRKEWELVKTIEGKADANIEKSLADIRKETKETWQNAFFKLT